MVRDAGRSLFPVTAWLAGLLFASYAFFMPAPASNEISRFNLVRSLVDRGRIDIDPFAETTADIARFGDHVYSDKAPGAALLAVPAYAAYRAYLNRTGAEGPMSKRESELRGHPVTGEDRLFFNAAFRRAVYFCNLATNALAGAALGGLFFALLARWGLRPTAALLATLAFALGSLAFAYSTVFFGHVVAAAALFAAFWLIDRAQSGDESGAGAVAAAGFLAGLAVLIELPAGLGAAILAVFVATGPRWDRARRLHSVVVFALAALPPVVVLAVYQWAAFGSPLSSGYAHVSHPTFAAGMSQGVLGVGWPRPGVLAAMYFGRTRGLFYLSPVLLFAVIGLASGVRAPTTRRRALVAVAFVLAFSLLSAGYYMWWGGAALGPRHVIPALPFLCLGFAWLPPKSGWLRGLFALTLAVSLVNQLCAVAVSPLVPPGVDLLFEHTYPRILRGDLPIYSGSANLGMLLGLRGLTSLLPLLVLWAIGAWTITRTLARLDAPTSGLAPAVKPG